MKTTDLNQETGYKEESYLSEIFQWLQDQPEAKEFDMRDERSIFYYTSLLTYAKLIYRYNKEIISKDKLAAAAPDLLKACQLVMSSPRGETLSFQTLTALYDAINKATE